MAPQSSPYHPSIRSSIAFRYLSIASIFLVVIQVLFGLLEIRRNFILQRNNLENRATAQAKFLSAVAPESVLNSDFLNLERLMEQSSEDVDIVYSVVVNGQGQPLTRFLNQADPLLAQALAEETLSQDILWVLETTQKTAGVKEIRMPILSNGESLGEIRLGYSIENLRQELRRAAATTLLISILVSALLATLTVILFNREVRTPLQKLAKLSQALADGNLNQQFHTSRTDEIGQLGMAFNHMAKQLQQTLKGLEEARDDALAANIAKSEFLSNMSHELRTPLNAILGFSQLMGRNEATTPEQQETLAIINRSGEHLLELINDVLEVTKIEAGRITLNPNAFDLHRLLNSLQAMLSLKAQNKGLQLHFDQSPEIPQYIYTDESKLRQVLINLLGNGIKFTQTGGVVLRVCCQPWEAGNVKGINDYSSSAIPDVGPQSRSDKTQGESDASIPSPGDPLLIHFEVEDTGPGITSDELDIIFNAFVQADTGRQSQQGTGLGLPISRKFVQLLGGELTVNSQVGQGTQFAFDIRTYETAAVKREVPTPRRVVGLASNQPRHRILVVEDTWESRQLLVKLLELVGFEVREAVDGKVAISLWEEWSPHLIWMDIRMPVMDGYEATRQIRSAEQQLQPAPNFQPTVILALTATAFEEQRQKVLAAGCDDFIRKPFKEELLFEKMADHLGVQYVYQTDPDSSPTETHESPQKQLLSPAELESQLAQIPLEWLTTLNQASVQLDREEVVRSIKQIASQQPALAITLENWVKTYRFDKVTAATDQVLAIKRTET